MEPVHRTEREITYQVGWKRGKIKLHTNNLEAIEALPDNRESVVQLKGALVLNRMAVFMWRPAGAMPERYLQIALWTFPLLTFGISLWLVSKLTLQP
jgi:hypothetical protein